MLVAAGCTFLYTLVVIPIVQVRARAYDHTVVTRLGDALLGNARLVDAHPMNVLIWGRTTSRNQPYGPRRIRRDIDARCSVWVCVCPLFRS